jgi:glycosyltransferase involved in cell wall biosynthesis
MESYAQVGGAEAYAYQVIRYLQNIGHQNIVIYAKEHPSPLQFTIGQTHHVPYPPYPNSAADAIQAIQQIIAVEQPDVAFIHHIYHPALIESVVRSLPTVSYVQAVYLVCPGSRQYFPRSEQICPHAAGPICIWNGQVKKCVWGRNPLTHIRLLQRVRDYLRVYQEMHKIFVGSTYMVESLCRNGLPAEKIVISPTFLLEEKPDSLPVYPDRDTPTILFSGRLVREKGLHHLLAALKEIDVPWRLVVAGTGPDEARCRELATAYQIAPKVSFLGWISDQKLQTLMATSDIVTVLPLLAEAFGRVGPEAFVHGRPVIAYASGGITDWLHHEYNGLLVPPGDISALRQALVRLLTSPTLRQQLGQQAYKRVIVDYPIEKHLPSMLSILEEARVSREK